ncbi:DUF262 domain-containing protein [Nocardia sp. NPDC088792]|uniref:DUF262 domain-containing protein n=1 Tax=Nocardia sp. NPDC088792 TaxID=3364332 RepID=UPI003818042C
MESVVEIGYGSRSKLAKRDCCLEFISAAGWMAVGEGSSLIASANQYPVHELLSPENKVVYQVPKYQREYSWSRQQWDNLFDDLLDAAGADAEHFLGTIICVNQTHDATTESVLELIDGQQRMTTLSLLLAAIYGCLQEHCAEFDDDRLTDLTNLRRQLVLSDPPRPRLRPQIQNSNRDDYLNVLDRAGVQIKTPKVLNLGNRRIMKAFRHFGNRITEHAEQSSTSRVDVALEMLKRVKQAVLVKLEVKSHSDAFVLFESLNNRGMPLTPIDLIKNNLLKTADGRPDLGLDEAFARWNALLVELGDDYTNQERFFRQYYNAFKTSLPVVANAPVATRSRLIRIYETLIAAGLVEFLETITEAGSYYKRILGNLDDEDVRTSLDDAIAALSRAQGSPSHILLLFLMRRRAELCLAEADLERITRRLASFFVRRNLTGIPQTYSLTALFMDIIDRIGDVRGAEVEEVVRESLRRVSASDEQFLEKLSGPIYDENADVARFILVSIAEQGTTRENRPDFWERESNHYKWTIEHILPQGENLPPEWVEMLGDATNARHVQQIYVHTLGNLTLTGYNSSLSNKSFDYKKDRLDGNGNYIGFRNGLRLNEDVVKADRWTDVEIKARTARLAHQALELFPI